MKFILLLASLFFVLNAVEAHFPVYSLYKERKPVDVFQALNNARQSKRRAGGFDEMYGLPFPAFYRK